MRKGLLILTVLASFGIQMYAADDASLEGMEPAVENVIQPIGNKTVHVVGVNGKILEIFNLTGVKVSQIRIEEADCNVELSLPKGCYILKIGKIVRKISIQ